MWLDRFPPSLYTDEASQGYNAFSILLTGRDEHRVLLPVSLRSFGDWKPPLPTYLMIPFIALMGLTEEAVRLPSVFLGLGTVIITFLLVKELFRENKGVTSLALLSSFFLAISPWHILQSRAAMLVMTGLFFIEGGIYFLLRGFRQTKFLLPSVIFFVLSLYSYYGLRIITPLVLLFMLFHHRAKIVNIKKQLLLSIIIGALLLLPLLTAFLKESDVVFGRAKTVSIFYDKGVRLKQWELITQDGSSSDPFLTRFFHNGLYLYGKDVLQRFLSHFNPEYLFMVGDKSQPFQIPNMGIIYFIDYFLIAAGLMVLYRNKIPSRGLTLSWLLISFIPASFTFMTPSSNRTFTAVIPFVILASLTLLTVFHSINKKRKILFINFIVILYVFTFSYFLRQYFYELPQKHADWWYYGWKQVVGKVNEIESCCNDIIIADNNGMPYIYFLFYSKYDPAKFQREAIRTYEADQFGFEHIEGYGKYLFQKDFVWRYIKDNLQSKTIYVVPAEQIDDNLNMVKTIYLPNNKPVYKIIKNV